MIGVTVTRAEARDAESLAAMQKRAFERLYEIYRDAGSPYLRDAGELKTISRTGRRISIK